MPIQKLSDLWSSLPSEIAANPKKLALLLGNGFSRCFSEKFAYTSLLAESKFEGLSIEGTKLFGAAESSDFETVMRSIQTTAKILSAYDQKSPIAAYLMRDYQILRKSLIDTIARVHPGTPDEISPDKKELCKTFLKKFGKVYTLNYDFVLYWLIMDMLSDDPDSHWDDGFRSPEVNEGFVVWKSNDYQQNVHYLHGALHLFKDVMLKKLTWIRTGIPLKTQIEGALLSDLVPHVIASGSHTQKLKRINECGYLSKNFRTLQMSGYHLLVAFGVSFDPTDDHIFEAIHDSKIREVWVSVYRNDTKVQRQWDRATRGNLKVSFFDAESVEFVSARLDESA